MTRSSTASNTFVPKRGRPTAEQVEAIERSILGAAWQMFLASGYDAVAMEGVAAAAGVSKGTLYARHPSKEDLFAAIVKSRVREWSQEASQRDHLLTEEIGERLRHHGRTIAHSAADPEVAAFRRLLLVTQDRFPELSRAMYEAGYLYIVRLVSQDIAGAAERDGIPARDPDAVARMFVSAITGWLEQESGGGAVRAEALAEAADRIAGLFLAARADW